MLGTAPEGLTAFSEQHPDVPIVTASVDRELNEHAYILPGLERCRRPYVRYKIKAKLAFKETDRSLPKPH